MTRPQPTRHGHGGKPEPEVGKDRSPRAKTRPTSPAGEVFVTLSLLADGNDEKRNSQEGVMVEESDAAHEEKDALLADDSPHNDLYSNVVPVWCGASQDDLDAEIGDGYSCGFSVGFERGIITAMLRPEWVQGMYYRLRDYYLSTHTPQDLLDWDDHAEETTRAIPVTMLDMDDQAAHTTVLEGGSCLAPKIGRREVGYMRRGNQIPNSKTKRITQ